MLEFLGQERGFALEHELMCQGYLSVAGLDEAGRGALAGPVVAAAVVFHQPSLHLIEHVRDSKKLSPRWRERLFEQITTEALDYSVGIVDAEAIDAMNILNATLKAMAQAVEGLKVKPNIALVDGHIRVPLDIPQQTLVKGDDRVLSIGAASIVAKVTRDRMMIELDERYPDYGFAVHKGYGTLAHRQALSSRGPSPVHRKSFKWCHV